ncbi:MAG TPA: hemerythrin domain-containing protein [Actinomycetales bacterium]|nr:hemerythrin domain-containing protein [Actinomycetales bacterium]
MADDIVDVIKAQHREVDRLLDEAMAEGSDTAALLRQVSELLIPHSEAEESFVYPTIGEKKPPEGEEVHDSVAEHQHIEEVLQALLAEDPDTPGFDGRLAGLVGELRHHVEEEEQDLLPVLSEQASDDERAAMGARFAQETGWTGGTGPTGGSGDAADGDESGPTRAELYEQAKEQDVPGRSKMSKAELGEAVEDD